MSQSTFDVHASLDTLLPLYDAFLLDQWGVIHNGFNALPGAPAALCSIAASGLTKVIVVSNSTKRASATLSRLDEMGFDSSDVTGMITSGEVNWHGFKEHTDRFWVELGSRCLVFGNAGSTAHWLEGLNELEPVDSADQAEFILAMGVEVCIGSGSVITEMSVPDFMPLMRDGVARGLPMLCGNPDLHTVMPDGTLGVVVGTLAEQYKELGGDVRYVGKPYKQIYTAALSKLSELGITDLSRVAMVGDSLHHDVAGALGAGIKSIFLPGGVHFGELGISPGPQSVPGPPASALTTLFEKHGLVPDHVLLGFTCLQHTKL